MTRISVPCAWLFWMVLASLVTVQSAVGQRNRALAFPLSSAILTDGDTVQGVLAYYPKQDLIRVTQHDQTVVTLSAARVLVFAVRGAETILLAQPSTGGPLRVAGDEAGSEAEMGFQSPAYQEYPQLFHSASEARDAANPRRVRVFRSFFWNHDEAANVVSVPGFFEQLTAGPYPLLRRQTFESTADITPTGGRPYVTTRDHFYCSGPAGRIVALRHPRKDLLTLFPAQAQLLDSFIREHQFTCRKAGEMVQVMDYLNSLPIAR